MLSANKKRTVVSYENISPALSAAFSEKYPKGFNDYFQDLMKFEKPDGTSFYAVTVETEDTISLVKIKVRTDDIEDIERWLDGDDGGDDSSSADSGGDNTEELPDDNIGQYSANDDDGGDV